MKIDRLLQIINEGTGVVGVNESTRFDSLGMDSLEFISLIQEVERAFECRIEDSQYAKLHTVADLLAVIP